MSHFSTLQKEQQGMIEVNFRVKFSISEVTELSLYRYKFSYKAVRVSVKGKEMIFCFEDKKTAEGILEKLGQKCPNTVEKLREELHKYQQMWVNGWMSNFDYLMLLNKLANRSFCDISQYPVMPWVLKQYSSSELDLENPRVYRDLEKPIGALNEDKLEKYKTKYYEVIKQNSDEEPYMYTTHYSSSGIVLYYLIRNIPSQILRLQNGGFGPADRIFFDIEMCWNNCINIFSDLKELIPEFYTGNGDFLINKHGCELGLNHLSEKVEDVVLPNWAESPTDFITKMRQALESDHVTRNLHHWIDLIFGVKQRGEKAFYANNLFYPMTYEENVKLDD